MLRRFHNCDDGVWESFVVSYPNNSNVGTAEVTLRARDCDERQLGHWYNIRIRIDGVIEFRLTNSSRYYTCVLSSGMQVRTFGDLVWVIFDLDDEAQTVEEVKGSQFYICGSKCEAEIGPMLLV